MVLSLDYSDLSGSASNANKLANELGQYCDELSKKVQQKMYNVSGGMSSALNSADYYVKAKINKLRKKESAARTLSQKTDALVTTAKRVDEDVERTIKNREKDFFKKNPDLKPAKVKAFVTSLVCDIKNFATNIPIIGSLIGSMIDFGEGIGSALGTLTKNIKYWYKCEGGKELVGIVLSAVGAVLAVVVLVCAVVFTGGGALAVIAYVAGIIGALIGVLNSVTNVVTSFQAYEAAMGGHPGMAHIYAGQNTYSDFLRGNNFNNKTLNRMSYILAAGIEITDAVCSAVTLVAGAVKAFKDLKKINIKKTFRSMGMNRSKSGRFLPGKPTLWNGIKSVCMKFDLKTLVLGDLNVRNLSCLNTMTFGNKMKTIGTLTKAVKGIVGDFDKINEGNLSWGEFTAKRVLIGINQSFFGQQKIIRKDGERKYVDTNFTSIVKNFNSMRIFGLFKFANDTWGSKTFDNIVGFKGGLYKSGSDIYKSIKDINKSLVKSNIKIDVNASFKANSFSPITIAANPIAGFILPNLKFNFNFSFTYPYLNIGDYTDIKPIPAF